MPRMPGADWRPLTTNHRSGGNTPRILILHIIVGTLEGADSWFRNPSSRVSAHFGTSRSGELRQWVDTGDQAWANRAANSYSVSVENEGHVGDSLTDAQLDRCAEILAWAHRAHGIALRVNDAVAGSGVSYHRMDRSWGVTECPGNPIIAQRAEVVRRARNLVDGTPDPEDFLEMSRRVWYSHYVPRDAEEPQRIPAGEIRALWMSQSSNDNVSPDNRYVSWLFSRDDGGRAFQGHAAVRLEGEDGADPGNYYLFTARVPDDNGAHELSGADRFLGIEHGRKRCTLPIDTETRAGTRCRLYVHAYDRDLFVTGCRVEGRDMAV